MENVRFSIVCKFSMLFNGKFASCHFPMLFNGKFAFCHLPMLYNGNLRIGKVQGGTYGRTYVRTDGRKEIHPCVLQDIVPLGPLPKKESRERERQKPAFTTSFFLSFFLSIFLGSGPKGPMSCRTQG